MGWSRVHDLKSKAVHIKEMDKKKRQENEKNLQELGGLPGKEFQFDKFANSCEISKSPKNMLKILENTQNPGNEIRPERTKVSANFSSENFLDVGKFSNFTVEIILEIFEISRNDSPQEKFLLRVVRRNRYGECFPDEFPILKSHYYALPFELERKDPGYCVTDREAFKIYLLKIYEDFERNRKQVYRYNFSGWHRDEVSGHLVYLHNGLGNVQSRVSLMPDVELAKIFFQQFMNLSEKKSHLFILLLHSLWGYMAVFYEEKKLDGCRTLLYLSAETGTGKTSLAKILTEALLEQEGCSVLRFEDTKASIEESLLAAKDQITLIDDFHARGDRLNDRDFMDKVSTITRIVGDGQIRGKMSPARKPLPERRYRGAAIATGEFIELNTFSSYLRCWVLQFHTGDIKFNDSLTFLQRNKRVSNAFFSLWISWLQENQQMILQGLANLHYGNLDKCHRNFPKLYPRLASSLATLLTVWNYASIFLKQFGIDIDFEAVYSGILNEGKEQVELLKTKEPDFVFIEALKESLDNARLILADSEEDFRRKDSDGFLTETHLYVITNRLEDMLERYAVKKSYGIKWEKSLKERLIRKGILIDEGKGVNFKYSKLRYVEPRRPRIYKISRGAITNGKE